MNSSKEKIGIIGAGIVGSALADGFSKHEIRSYDKYKPSFSLDSVCTWADIIFICLPTPYKGSKIDLTIIEEVIEEITPFTNSTDKIIVIKSTIIPGTTRRFSEEYPHTKFAFSPEFLTEDNFIEDFANADRHVIGAFDTLVADRINKLYTSRWPEALIINSDPTTAELGKYASNCFLATKVIFANEMHELSNALQIDWDVVKSIVVADERIGNTHFDVTPERGFSKKCFPKDMIAILGLFSDLSVDSSLLTSVWEKNLRIRKVHDWKFIPFVEVKEEDEDVVIEEGKPIKKK